MKIFTRFIAITIFLFLATMVFNIAKAQSGTSNAAADTNTKKSVDINASLDDFVIIREGIALEAPIKIAGAEGAFWKVKVQPKAMGLEHYFEFVIIANKNFDENSIKKGSIVKYIEGHTAAKDGVFHANLFRIYISPE